jgi:hypothetical protein
MCSHLTILPRQQSLGLSGYSRYSVDSIPFELSFSNFLSHNTKLTVPEVHVCTCTDDYKLYHPLERYSSTFIIFHSQNLMATCCLNLWLTRQLLTDSIGTHYQNDTTLDHSYVWVYMHLPTHTLTYYSCRGQPSELDIPWSDIQRIGSLSYDSFFVSCLNLEDILSLLPVAGHLEGWYIAYLLFYCLDSSYPCFHSEENVRWHTSHKHTYRFHNDNSRPLNTYSYHTWPIPFQECLIQSSGSISYSFQTYPW